MSQAISASPTFDRNAQALSSTSSSRAQIDGRAVSLIATQEDSIECVICYVDSLPGEPLSRRKLKCGHEFHAHCINKWLNEGSGCPLCRRNIQKYSLGEKALVLLLLTELCVGSGTIMINHLDHPLQGVFKTTCFALSSFFVGTAINDVLSGRLNSPTKTLMAISGAFAVAYTLI